MSRALHLAGVLELEALGRGVQPDEPRNDLTRNTNFGPARTRPNPSPTFGQITAVGEPRSLQFGGAGQVLIAGQSFIGTLVGVGCRMMGRGRYLGIFWAQRH